MVSHAMQIIVYHSYTVMLHPEKRNAVHTLHMYMLTLNAFGFTIICMMIIVWGFLRFSH